MKTVVVINLKKEEEIKEFNIERKEMELSN